MATIGGYYMISLSHRPQPMGETVREITRPEADGQAYAKQGLRAEATLAYAATDCASAAAARTEMAAYAAMRGALVTVVDDLGESYTNVLVVDVRERGRKVVCTAVGGVRAGTVLLLTDWVLQATGVS